MCLEERDMRVNASLLALMMVMATAMAFSPAARLSGARSGCRKSDLRMNAPEAVPELLKGAYDPVYNYVNFWVKTGMFDIAPDWLIHWGHPAAMGMVLIAMGGIGSYAGYQIRAGNGDETAWFTTGKTIREQHPLIMGLAGFFFLLGGQGGLVLLLQQGKPILESPHALTAVVGLGLLAVQALLPVLAFEKGGATARTAHTVLGTSTMVALSSHLVTGLNLGTSF